jgi:hypothetical protein
MIEDLQKEHERKNAIRESKPIGEGYCPICDTTQRGIHDFCVNKSCSEFGRALDDWEEVKE